MTPNTATGRPPGRWLYAFPLLLLVGAGWSATVHGMTRSSTGDETAGSDTDQYGPRRFRLAGTGAIVDTATGITRNVDPGDSGSLAERFAAVDSGISSPPVPVEATRDLSAGHPVRLRVEAVGVDADVVPIGVDESRALEVPTRVDVAGWWSGGFVPGENGPTVIVGHRDSKDAAGLFSKLGDLARGDLVAVERADQTTVFYRVDSVERFKKTSFPTERVYGTTPTSTLRLITCGGKFNRTTGHYVDNVIVYATLAWINGSEPDGPWQAVPPTGLQIPSDTVPPLATTTLTPTSTTKMPTLTSTTSTLPATSTTTMVVAKPTTSTASTTFQTTTVPSTSSSTAPNAGRTTGEPATETAQSTSEVSITTTLPIEPGSA